ncbi:MAG: AraC family transcriptional regulator [Lachnospiraceae bacterium]|nr:AraC family transcriptional regulator [Lachnospiraceae bacterium]
MKTPFEWSDVPFHSKERIVRTTKELQIPGLRMFGKHTMTNAVSPLPPHFHRNSYEFTFVTNGAISFTTEKDTYELNGYDVFMTRPNEIHSTNLLPLSAGEIIWFQLDITETDEFLFLSPRAREHLLSMLSALKGPLFSSSGNRSLSMLRRAYELSASVSDRFQCAACLVLALYELSSAAQKAVRSVTPDIETTLRYIKEHIYDELSLDELAGLCGLSVSQFKQKFKAQVGTAPRHYINYKKIQTAKKLLKDGLPVTEVAMSLGFNSSSYFTVVFKRYNACSPSEYIQQNQNR